MKVSSAAFSVYNNVKKIFLEFSDGKHYKGHIDSEKLQQALSGALGKECSQDEVDRALQAFQEERGEARNVGDDGDASTTNGSCDTQSIRMPEFLVLMQHLEAHRETNCFIAEDVVAQEDSSLTNRNPEEDQDPLSRSVNFLYPHRKILCVQENGKDIKLSPTAPSRHDQDFQAAFAPTEMRYLALVSHNGMKSTMKRFVLANKNIIKKFRLTGTNSTMTMLREVLGNDPEVVYGPSCSSGPLGGDAELAALVTQGQMGGIIFFQDPMSAHPHQADIDSLNRLALVHNTMIANNPTSAVMMMNVLRSALKGQGQPELIPSFFLSMVSPAVASYQAAQKQMILQSIADEASSVGGSTAMLSVKKEPTRPITAERVSKTSAPPVLRNLVTSSRPSSERAREEPPTQQIVLIETSSSDLSGGNLSRNNTSRSQRPKSRQRRVSISETSISSSNPQKKQLHTSCISSLGKSMSSIVTSKTIDTTGHTQETESDDEGPIFVRKITSHGSHIVGNGKKEISMDRRPRWR